MGMTGPPVVKTSLACGALRVTEYLLGGADTAEEAFGVSF
jgi:hypothetical protein